MPSRSKIARLPLELRDQLNTMLRDGVAYDVIIAKNRDHGVALTKSDLSRWYKRGFQQWVKQHLWLDEMKDRLEYVLGMVLGNQQSQLPDADAARQMAAFRLFEFLQQLDPSPATANTGEFIRSVHALCRLSENARPTNPLQPSRVRKGAPPIHESMRLPDIPIGACPASGTATCDGSCASDNSNAPRVLSCKDGQGKTSFGLCGYSGVA